MSRLALTAAALEMLSGLAVYLFPPELGQRYLNSFDLVPPTVPALLLAGSILLFLARRCRPLVWRRTLLVIGATPLLALAHQFTLQQDVAATLAYGMTALGLTVFALLPPPDRATNPDPSAITLGLIEGSLGFFILVAPGLFTAPGFLAPLQGWLPAVGVAGVVGATALVAPGRLGWSAPDSAPRRAVALVLPGILLYAFIRQGVGTGVLVWGVWGLSLLRWNRRLQDPAAPDEHTGAVDDLVRPQLRSLEAMLETWIWLLALVVVGLSAKGELLSYPLSGTFIFAVALYNVSVHWVFAAVGRRSQRVLVHLVFFAVAVGYLHAVSDARLGHVFLTLLVLAPALGSQAAGIAAGNALVGVVGVTALVSEVAHASLYGKGWLVAALEAGVYLLVLVSAAAVGARSVGLQEQLLQQLGLARADQQRQLRQQALLAQISSAIRRSLDLDVILETTVTELGHALGVSRCFFRFRRGDLPLFATHEFTAAGITPVSATVLGRAPALRVATTTLRVAAINDVANDPLLDDPAWGDRDRLLAADARAILAAPILVEDEFAGLLVFHQCGHPRTWTPDEITFVEAMADQVGIALTHARAHRHLAERNGQLQAALDAVGHAEKDRERLVAILEATTDFVAIANLEKQITYMNRAGRRTVGVTDDDDVTALSLTDNLPPWAQALVDDEAIPTAVRTGVWRGETAFVDGTDNRETPLSQVILAHRAPDGQVEYLSTIARDISGRKQLEAQLTFLADHDPLTGLLNRRSFVQATATLLARARRQGTAAALLYIDLDNFKAINDNYGHRAGDAYLRRVAEVMLAAVREGDLAARLGGDEFAVFLPEVTRQQAQAVADRIVASLRSLPLAPDDPGGAGAADAGPGDAGPAPVAGGIQVGVSVGIALFPEHGDTPEELYGRADQAMYQAKAVGNCCRVYQGSGPKSAPADEA